VKISKRQLKRIIQEEKRKILKESSDTFDSKTGGIGPGFGNWSPPTKKPDYAQLSYGRDRQPHTITNGFVNVGNEDQSFNKSLTDGQLRDMVSEFFGKASDSTEGSEGGDIESLMTVNTLGSGDISASWTRSGLALELHVNGKPVISLANQGDAMSLRDMLNDLLEGPMRTMP